MVSTLTAVPSYEGTFTASANYRLFEQAWEPAGTPRSTIVLLHGYAEHSSRYQHIAACLVENGHAVYTYDHRGHGRSEGKRAYVENFNAYLEDLHIFLQRVTELSANTPIFLFGHSMGGAIGALYCIERHPDLAGLILSSPALVLEDSSSHILSYLIFAISSIFPAMPTVKLDRRKLSHDQAVVEKACSDPLNYHGRMPARTAAEFLHATHRIQAGMDQISLPFLVFHGTADQLTDVRGSCQLYHLSCSEDKTLGLYEGFYHETFNEPKQEQVLDELVTWLDEHL